MLWQQPHMHTYHDIHTTLSEYIRMNIEEETNTHALIVETHALSKTCPSTFWLHVDLLKETLLKVVIIDWGLEPFPMRWTNCVIKATEVCRLNEFVHPFGSLVVSPMLLLVLSVVLILVVCLFYLLAWDGCFFLSHRSYLSLLFSRILTEFDMSRSVW